MRLHIQDYDRQLVGELVRLEKSFIPEKDKKLLLEFRDHNISKDIIVPRMLRQVSALRLTAERLKKGFDEVTEVKNLKCALDELFQMLLGDLG